MMTAVPETDKNKTQTLPLKQSEWEELTSDRLDSGHISQQIIVVFQWGDAAGF